MLKLRLTETLRPLSENSLISDLETNEHKKMRMSHHKEFSVFQVRQKKNLWPIILVRHHLASLKY